MVAVVGVLGATARTADLAEESVTLLQLVRAQIETIQQSPYEDDASDYASITGVPEGVTVTFASTDPGTTYTYPAPDSTTLTNVVQQIAVTATGDDATMSISFYKVKMP